MGAWRVRARGTGHVLGGGVWGQSHRSPNEAAAVTLRQLRAAENSAVDDRSYSANKGGG